MSNQSSEPAAVEAINALLRRVDAMERAPQAWTRGQVILWYGLLADVPTYWHVCDGTPAPDGVTPPDMRGRVPVGVNASDSDFNTLGETGGAKSVDLDHAHTWGGPTYNSGPVAEAGGDDDDDLDTTVNLTHGGTDKVARHLHTHFVQGNTSTVDLAASVVQPYATFHFLYRWA